MRPVPTENLSPFLSGDVLSPDYVAPALNGPSFRRKPRRILVVSRSAPALFLQKFASFARQWNWHLCYDMLHTGAIPVRWDGDGMIAMTSYPSDISDFVAESRLPCVTVGSVGEDETDPSVFPDMARTGQAAALHLLERGCTSFVWAPFVDDTANRLQFEAFNAVIRQRKGCSCQILPPAHRRIGQAWHDNWTEWSRSMATLCRDVLPGTGLFAFNDCLSAKVLAAAVEMGIAVPDSLAIIGAGNNPFECESADITLSSVDPNFEEMAEQAATLLYQLLDGITPLQRAVAVPPKGIAARQSTVTHRSDYPRIEHAIAYVLAHCADPSLCVSTLAEAVGVSRRQLERDFRSGKGCTIRAFIEEARILRASQLLIEHPQTKIMTIAESIGISDPNCFFRKFRKRFGVTPTAFRRQANS